MSRTTDEGDGDGGLANASPQRPPASRKRFLDLLDAEDRRQLTARCLLRRYKQDELIFKQGEAAGQLIVIEQGLVKVSLRSTGKHTTMLAIRGAGDIIGEMATIDAGRRSATVTALNPVAAMLLEPPVDEVLRLPSVNRALLTVVVRRLREADGRRILFSRAKLPVRVASLLAGLIEYGSKRGSKIVLEMELSQEDLASAVGASRSAVNRALAELRAKQILTTERQRITILRPDLLTLMAQ